MQYKSRLNLLTKTFLYDIIYKTVNNIPEVVFLQYLWYLIPVAIIAIIIKLVFLKKGTGVDTRSNIDAIIGERCVVTEKIDNYAGCGQVRVNGQEWSARGAGENDVFEAGEALKIVAIEGVKLICRK